MEINKRDLIDFLYAADVDPDEDVRWNYSGRGMYGRTCFGIVGKLDDLLKFVYFCGVTDGIEQENDRESIFADMMSGVCSDSMGYDTIYYWPELVVLVGEEDEEDLEDEDDDDA